MNFGEIKDRVWDRLDEDSATPLRYSQELILFYLRQATEQWAITSGGIRKTQTISLVANQLAYTIDKEYTRVISVIDATTSIPLVGVSYRELYDSQGSGAGLRWRLQRSVRPTHYVLFTVNQIWLWPPLSSVTSETVTVTYDSLEDNEWLATPDTSVADANIPMVPPEYHHLLVDYITGMCLILGARGDRVERARELVLRWITAVDGINDRRATRGAIFAPTQRAIVGR